MALMPALFDANRPPGARTAELALAVLNDQTGVNDMVYRRLSSLQCWDAALFCAWIVNGVQCADVDLTSSMFPVTTANNFARLFGANPPRAASIAELMMMPQGCFVGFVRNGILRHTMVHVGNGWGAGNKNDCVLRAGHTIGWERLDMSAFFLADSGFNNNGTSAIVYRAVTGQVV